MTRRDYRTEALASPNWQWVPGMRWVVRRAPPLEDYFGCLTHSSRPHLPPGAVPDWTDPGTLGCLLHRVRELWASPTAYARLEPYYLGVTPGAVSIAWGVYAVGGLDLWGYPTEADALCSALVDAPRLPRPEVPRANSD